MYAEGVSKMSASGVKSSVSVALVVVVVGLLEGCSAVNALKSDSKKEAGSKSGRPSRERRGHEPPKGLV